MRAVRGAISVISNTKNNILKATKKLLKEILKVNNIVEEEIVCINFTATYDLNKVYPAVAAREIGLNLIPLLCYQEMKVVGSLEKCIRVMVYINRDCKLNEIKHVYLKKAKKLRPDLLD